MVDCSHFLEEYSDYRDGLLDEARTRFFDAHLAECPECARYDRVVEQGVNVARRLPHLEPSYDFQARLQHRIYNVDEELRRARRPSSGSSVGLMLAIASVIGVSAWLPTLRPQPAVVTLPPVTAHAPHRVEAVHVLFRPGPLLEAPQPVSSVASPVASNLLFYRYSPVGTYVSQPAHLPWPR